MNIVKRIISVMLVIAMSVTLFACSKSPKQKNNFSQNTNGDFTIESVSETIDRSNMYSKRDLSATYDDNVYTVTLQDDSSTSTCSSVKIDSNIITIVDSGTYVLSGKLSDGEIVVDAEDDDKVQIVLNNVEITNKSTATIYVINAKKVFVTSASNSSNLLSSLGDFEAVKKENVDATIYSKDDLTLNGSGQLSISSKNGHGVVSKDDLVLADGTYTINANKHAIKANDSVVIAGGEYSLTSGEDGIHCDNDDDSEKGYIYISDCDISINAGDDALHASYYLVVDDGIINIENSYEGLEAQKIDINGGTINVKSSDDGLNASSGSSNTESGMNNDPMDTDENCYINITGGTLTIDADGDGIDSNGYLQQTGGDVTVYGPENSGNGALDYGISAKITGGTIVAFGYSGMADSFDSCSTQCSINVTFQNSSTSTFELKDSDGNVLISKESLKSYNDVVVSSPDIAQNSTYTVSSGDESIEVEMTSITYSNSNNMMSQGGGMGKMSGNGQNFNK